MKGYDELVSETVRNVFDSPLTILGRAGSLENIKKLIEKFRIIGVAAESLFVFKGKHKAILSNYLYFEEKKALF